jgi:hypothetical protein
MEFIPYPFNPPIPPKLPGPNHPDVCRLSGERGPAAPLPDGAGEAEGMTSGCVLPRCNGGGDTLDTLPRLGRVVRVRAGPPLVEGGSMGGCAVDRDRERDREKSSPRREKSRPEEEGGRTGEGV